MYRRNNPVGWHSLAFLLKYPGWSVRIRQQIKDILASHRPSMADFEVALIARILKAVLFLAALTASGVPIWYAYRCGLLLATEETSAWQFGLVGAVIAACSVAMPSLAVGAWKRGRVGRALVRGLTSACLLGFSIYGTATVELMQRAVQASERDGEDFVPN